MSDRGDCLLGQDLRWVLAAAVLVVVTCCAAGGAAWVVLFAR